MRLALKRYDLVQIHMNSTLPQHKVPGGKPESDGDVPPWQLILGGVVLTVVSMAVGARISEIIFLIWMPGALR